MSKNRWHLPLQIQGKVAYVATQENGEYFLWNPLSGLCYKQFDAFCPLQSADCLISWENVSICKYLILKMVQKLQLIENVVAWVVIGARWFESVGQMLHWLHWLPICFWAQFRVWILTFKALNGLGSCFLRDHLLLHILAHSPCHLKGLSFKFCPYPRLDDSSTGESLLCNSTTIMEFPTGGTNEMEKLGWGRGMGQEDGGREWIQQQWQDSPLIIHLSCSDLISSHPIHQPVHCRLHC